MCPSVTALLAAIGSSLRKRAELEAEILALRHQLAVLQQAAPRRLRFSRADRFFWVLLSRVWRGWRDAVQIVQPATVVAWHRRLFAWHWRWRSAQPRVGRPPAASDVRVLIQKMHRANPLWGAPRIHGELQKLGIEIGETTVAKYLGRRPPHRPGVRSCEHICRSVPRWTSSPSQPPPSASSSSSSSFHTTAAASFI